MHPKVNFLWLAVGLIIGFVGLTTLGGSVFYAAAIPSVLAAQQAEGASQQGAAGIQEPAIAAGLLVTESGTAQQQTSVLLAPGAASRGPERPTFSSRRVRKITLEQVKHSVDPVASPGARLAQLSIEAARQHRLGVQADYYPKIGAGFANLHYSDFLGQVITVRRPFAGTLLQVPIPLFSQNQTVAFLTLTQPLTPLLVVHQAVKIARADERVARAKAGVAISQTGRKAKLEETYFELLIAQRRLTAAEAKLRAVESERLYAAAAIDSVGAPRMTPETVEAQGAVATAATKVKALTASLNGAMGWADDTELDLTIPDPLVENISLAEVADKSVSANPEVIEAEENVVKARAATTISKLAYVPTVAAVGGYVFQNVIPAVTSNFGYGGVIASYNLFDFGKREAAVKEARAQLGMAEIALQLTRAKVAADLKKSYFELEHSRELSNVAQKMGSSMALLVRASASAESGDAKAAVAEMEIQMLQADLAHRQAYARLQALLGSRPR